MKATAGETGSSASAAFAPHSAAGLFPCFAACRDNALADIAYTGYVRMPYDFAGLGQLAGLLRRRVDVAGIGRGRRLRPDVARRKLLRACRQTSRGTPTRRASRTRRRFM